MDLSSFVVFPVWKSPKCEKWLNIFFIISLYLITSVRRYVGGVRSFIYKYKNMGCRLQMWLVVRALKMLSVVTKIRHNRRSRPQKRYECPPTETIAEIAGMSKERGFIFSLLPTLNDLSGDLSNDLGWHWGIYALNHLHSPPAQT